MDNTLYWIIEYAKVMCGYGFLMFVWPLVVFRKYLRNKSVTFKFSFCVTAQVVIINTAVLGLGLFHILNKWTMLILFYGTFLYSIRHSFALTTERKTKFKYLVHGSFGVKNFILLERRKYTRKLEEVLKRFGAFYKKHWLEYSLLVAALIYGMLYFSWGAFQSNSYGFGDMYVHHQWIYQLTEGNIFYAGVYPEAMHCVIYSMHTLFGINIYSCLLFLAGIHIAIILLAAYCFMKEIFHWRFSPVFVLILFLIVDVVCVDEVFSMSRLQWTLPQEYGFHTIYLCALYLLKYLFSEKKGKFKNKETKGCWDENLLVFTLSLATSIVIHFYVTIMAFFLCAAVALFALKKIFNKRHFIPLVAGVMLGVMVSVLPMLGALASGMQFQGSINWAVSVINGTNTEEGRTHAVQSGNNNNSNVGSGSTPGINTPENHPQENTPSQEVGNITGTEPKHTSIKDRLEGILTKVKYIIEKVKSLVIEKARGIYYRGYVTLYKHERAKWIVGVTCVTSLLCLAYGIYYLYRKIRRLSCEKIKLQFTFGYPVLILASFIFMVIYAAPFIGLPELIAGSRLCSTEQLLILMVFVILPDMIFMLFRKALSDTVLNGFSIVVAAGMIFMVYKADMYHGYLYYELTRYDAAVSVTNDIMESLPQYSYTVVSTTDEIYQVIQDGRHEEMLTFLSNQTKDNYTLPTQYIFIYVEKKPIRYAHNHFFAGPAWLAVNRYEEYYQGYSYSVGDEVVQTEVSEEDAAKPIRYYGKASQAYSNLESRTILESKMYQWCQQFTKLYPYELKTYYEDDEFVCYYIRQNVQRLYDLGLE